MITNNSIKLWLTGEQVDCTTKTSLPRTFSPISTIISPSLKVLTTTFPWEIWRCWQILAVSSGFELPPNTLSRSNIINKNQNSVYVLHTPAVQPISSVQSMRHKACYILSAAKRVMGDTGLSLRAKKAEQSRPAPGHQDRSGTCSQQCLP